MSDMDKRVAKVNINWNAVDAALIGGQVDELVRQGVDMVVACHTSGIETKNGVWYWFMGGRELAGKVGMREALRLTGRN